MVMCLNFLFCPQVPSGAHYMVPVLWTKEYCGMECDSLFYPLGTRGNGIHLVSHSSHKRSAWRHMWLLLLPPTGENSCDNVKAWPCSVQLPQGTVLLIKEERQNQIRSPYPHLFLLCLCIYRFTLASVRSLIDSVILVCRWLCGHRSTCLSTQYLFQVNPCMVYFTHPALVTTT